MLLSIYVLLVKRTSLAPKSQEIRVILNLDLNLWFDYMILVAKLQYSHFLLLRDLLKFIWPKLEWEDCLLVVSNTGKHISNHEVDKPIDLFLFFYLKPPVIHDLDDIDSNLKEMIYNRKEDLLIPFLVYPELVIFNPNVLEFEREWAMFDLYWEHGVFLCA